MLGPYTKIGFQNIYLKNIFFLGGRIVKTSRSPVFFKIPSMDGARVNTRPIQVFFRFLFVWSSELIHPGHQWVCKKARRFIWKRVSWNSLSQRQILPSSLILIWIACWELRGKFFITGYRISEDGSRIQLNPENQTAKPAYIIKSCVDISRYLFHSFKYINDFYERISNQTLIALYN